MHHLFSPLSKIIYNTLRKIKIEDTLQEKPCIPQVRKNLYMTLLDKVIFYNFEKLFTNIFNILLNLSIVRSGKIFA